MVSKQLVPLDTTSLSTLPHCYLRTLMPLVTEAKQKVKPSKCTAQTSLMTVVFIKAQCGICADNVDGFSKQYGRAHGKPFLIISRNFLEFLMKKRTYPRVINIAIYCNTPHTISQYIAIRFSVAIPTLLSAILLLNPVDVVSETI